LEPSDEKTQFAQAFERVIHDLPQQPDLRDVEIVTASAHKHRRDTALHVVVDKDGGVDVATCERIAALINAALDAFPDDQYTLEVESAGLDRPLVKPGDYERFSGRDAKIVTTLAIESAKTHRGRLLGVRGTNVILVRDGKELPIPLAVVKSANLEYDVRADLTRAKREKNKDK
jgi:ribosome maturation factor RimP